MEPDLPNQYRDKVEVTYTRDISSIVNPKASDLTVGIKYELFDPDADEPLEDEEHQEHIEENLRIGYTNPAQISEHVFQGYLEHVLIQNSPYQPKHTVYVQDGKLGFDLEDWFTAQGITVEGAYDLEIKGKRLFFKMR